MKEAIFPTNDHMNCCLSLNTSELTLWQICGTGHSWHGKYLLFPSFGLWGNSLQLRLNSWAPA